MCQASTVHDQRLSECPETPKPREVLPYSFVSGLARFFSMSSRNSDSCWFLMLLFHSSWSLFLIIRLVLLTDLSMSYLIVLVLLTNLSIYWYSSCLDSLCIAGHAIEYRRMRRSFMVSWDGDSWDHAEVIRGHVRSRFLIVWLPLFIPKPQNPNELKIVKLVCLSVYSKTNIINRIRL